MNEIKLPKCSMAADDDVLKQKREELRKRILNHEPISLKKGGEIVSSDDKEASMNIPQTILADDEERAKKRAELAEALRKGQNVGLKKGGEVTTKKGDSSFNIPNTKLAVLMQWYERDPMLLEAEKAAMKRDFPQFELIKLDDGRLAWKGAVKLNVLGDNEWHLKAVYQHNHPVQQMGSSIYVYLEEPSIEDLIEQLDWRPHHLLRDSDNRNYLCTTEAGYVKATNTQVTSANTVLRWAIKWLLAFELVLTGDMTTEEFDKPHGI